MKSSSLPVFTHQDFMNKNAAKIATGSAANQPVLETDFLRLDDADEHWARQRWVKRLISSALVSTGGSNRVNGDFLTLPGSLPTPTTTSFLWGDDVPTFVFYFGRIDALKLTAISRWLLDILAFFLVVELDFGNKENDRIPTIHFSLGIQSPCQWMIWVSNRPLSKVFRFHYHSQKVIGSLGFQVQTVSFRDGIYAYMTFWDQRRLWEATPLTCHQVQCFCWFGRRFAAQLVSGCGRCGEGIVWWAALFWKKIDPNVCVRISKL